MYTGILDHPLYTFTDSYGGEHVVEGWFSHWGHLSTVDINLPLFTTWLHEVTFKEPEELADYVSTELYGEFWEKYLRRLLLEAQWCSTKEQLNEALSWALIDDRPETARL